MPSDGVFGSFYSQAISKFAPHPAAARLWQEFLYSDEGQNIWLKGLSRPVRLRRHAGGRHRRRGRRSRRCPRSTPRSSSPTDEQQTAAQKVVADRWNAEMSG